MKTCFSFSFFIIFALCIGLSAKQYGGAGLVVAQLFDPSTTTNTGETVVLGVLPGSNEETQGIRPGDVIVEIDKKVTRGEKFDVIVNSLRGEVGSDVKLKVKRTSTDTLIMFNITRAEYHKPAGN